MKKFYKSPSGIKFFAEKVGKTIWVHLKGHTFPLKSNQQPQVHTQPSSTPRMARLTAPFPGRIIAIKVKPNDSISPQQHLVVIESMKMEHTLSIHHSATVQSILVKEGQTVTFEQKIMTFVPLSTNEVSNESN